MRDLRLWELLVDLLPEQPITLVITTKSKGSSPGKQGFKMLVGPEGRIMGTIGGGIMEARVITDIRAGLRNSRQPRVNELRTLVHRKGVENASGLNCSGWQEIALVHLDATYIARIEKIITNYQLPEPLFLSVSDTELIVDQSPLESDEILYSEQVGNPSRVYIFGAGHVGSAIAQQLYLLDFHVTLFDHREEIIDFHRGNYHKLKTGELGELQQNVIEGDRTYIIITSNSIDADIEALRMCLSKNVRYIGFMGSKTKIRMAKERLNSDLEGVHTPIGIKLPNETPAEIAVSVAAEIISIKYSD